MAEQSVHWERVNGAPAIHVSVDGNAWFELAKNAANGSQGGLEYALNAPSGEALVLFRLQTDGLSKAAMRAIGKAFTVAGEEERSA